MISKRIRCNFKYLFNESFSGQELKNNVKELTIVEIISAVSFFLNGFYNLKIEHYLVAAVNLFSCAIFLFCAYMLFFKNKRRLSLIIITVLLIGAFSASYLYTSNYGFSNFWILLFPFATMYLMGFKYGFIISTYFEILFLAFRFIPKFGSIIHNTMPEFYYTRYYVVYTVDYLLSLVIMSQNQLNRFRLHEYQWNLESILKIEREKVSKASIQTIISIVNAIQAKDSYTGNHSQRVAYFSGILASKLPNWDESRIENLLRIALVHDIGKIGIRYSILNKPGNLSSDEYDLIKQHTIIGSEILKDLDIIPNVTLGTKYHHERYDGTGYPCHLKGEEIPIEARIICIADSFDAMNYDRAYRKKTTKEYIITEFQKGKGTQFDPILTDIFIQILHDTNFFKSMGDFSILTEVSIENYMSLM